MTIFLPYDSMLTLPDAQGLRLACVKGALWITQDGDRSDTVLEEGQTFAVRRGGNTIVVAVRDARLAIVNPRPTQLSLICSSPTKSPAAAGLLLEPDGP